MKFTVIKYYNRASVTNYGQAKDDKETLSDLIERMMARERGKECTRMILKEE